MKTNLTLVVSFINKAIAFEWIAEKLNQQKFNISFVILNPSSSEIENYFKEKKINFLRIHYRNKKDIPKAIFLTYKFLLKNKIEVIHTHLFDANIVGLTAGYLSGVKKRIYTRHHSTYHHEFFPGAVKYDKIINFLATDIIAISENVKDVLLNIEKVNPKKIHLVHHGFRFEDFDSLNTERIDILRKKYHAAERYPVVGVIARYVNWKGIQYIIPAFKNLLRQYPNAYLIIANAEGNYSAEIKKLLQEINPLNYVEISYEKDFVALYKLFDVYVHVPFDNHSEAFGQTYVEALALQIPSVFTLSGIACEFVVHKKNSIVVNYKSETEIYEAIRFILQNPEFSKSMAQNGNEEVRKLFPIKKMISAFEKIYLD